MVRLAKPVPPENQFDTLSLTELSGALRYNLQLKQLKFTNTFWEALTKPKGNERYDECLKFLLRPSNFRTRCQNKWDKNLNG